MRQRVATSLLVTWRGGRIDKREAVSTPALPITAKAMIYRSAPVKVMEEER